MNLWETASTAWDSLLANKLRSFLTMLGILIGVSSIIAIFAIGTGGKNAIISTIESVRLQRTIQVLPTAYMAPGLPQPGQVLSFSQQDFDVAQQFTGVQKVYYTLYGQAYISANSSKTINVSLEAGPSFLNDIGHFSIVAGRMFSNADVLSHRNVVVLSAPLVQQLFGRGNALGQTVQIANRPFQVIGIATTSTQANLLSGFLGSSYIYMPGTTCKDLFPWWQISEMDVEVKPGVNKAELAHRIVMALNIHAHNANAFEDSSGFLSGIEHTIGTVTTILTGIIGAIAAIALIVGGVGVMNIMLVSVTERTQEIGIRMSLGATRRDIMVQFLVESVFITSIGGAIGIILGALCSLVITWVAHFSVQVPWMAAVGSFLFSALIGIICGIYPARKASRLNPIDALRYE